ncbi:glycoside hydrolase [Opitutaceae bacterium EW11]|nr:glycoside hydrolase [Opitutaceae bacterium EW11]
MNQRVSRTFFAALLAASAACFVQAGEAWGGDPIEPIRAPFPMPALTRPSFPQRVVSIVDHGALPGGAVKNTDAFRRAIEACANAGGGRVLVPTGRWLTGPIHLRSHIELHLAEGAEVVFSDRFEDYLPVVLVRSGGVDLYNYSPLIYARDCEDVAITGPGRLDGNARAWWAWKKKESKEPARMAREGVPVKRRVFGTPEAAIRPSFVVFLNCRNVLLEGFTIGGGPNWTVHPIYSENVVIRRVHVLTDGPNNDGIDPDSCRNVLVEHCVFDTGDDCLVLKSGYNEDGWRVGRPTENVVMRWCSSKKGHGGLVVGSEMSGGVHNVYLHDCTFDGTDHALRIKSRRDRGGVVENIWAENLTVRDMKYDVVVVTMDYGADPSRIVAEKPPIFRNITVRNVIAERVPVAVQIDGLSESPVENLRFERLTISSTRGVVARQVKNVEFSDVAIAPEKGPVFALTEARDVTIRRAKIAPGTERFLAVTGASSRGIRIEESDLRGVESPIMRSPEVPETAIELAK